MQWLNFSMRIFQLDTGLREEEANSVIFKSEAHYFYFILDRVGQEEGKTRDALIVYIKCWISQQSCINRTVSMTLFTMGGGGGGGTENLWTVGGYREVGTDDFENYQKKPTWDQENVGPLGVSLELKFHVTEWNKTQKWFFFDFCRCPKWTLNWILCEFIWKHWSFCRIYRICRT